MKILAIGDPHGNVEKLKKIPKKDISLIILTGDLGKADLARKRFFENVERKKKGLEELPWTKSFEKKSDDEIYYTSINVLKYLSKFAPVYFIYGNIEPFAKSRPEKGRKTPWLPKEARKIKGVKIINNKITNFKGVKIGAIEYFTDECWVKKFKPKDYQKTMKRAKKQTADIKKVLKKFKNIDIFIHHQPPFGVLDKVGGAAPKHWQGKSAGSKLILNYIKEKQPKYAFCGHIHEGEGFKNVGKTEVYNLGVCGYKIAEFK